MIGLPNFSSKFVEDYSEKIGDKVYNKAIAEKDFWKKYFPESCDDKRLKKQFFFDVLSLKIPDSCLKYSSIKTYFDFAFFASLNIRTVHGKETSKRKRTENRKRYIDDYVVSNTIANRLLKRFMLRKNPICSDKNFEGFQQCMKRALSIVNSYIEKSISYREEIKRKNRVNVLEDLNIKVCPYCNRQYIVKLDIDVGKPIGDIDHFFSQNYFALFGLSLYNFVPSCKICNSLFKSDINADVQYPYNMVEESNIMFRISDAKGVLSPGGLFGWNDDLVINVVEDVKDPIAKERAIREINFFELDAQYKIHKEYVREFLYKKNMVNGVVISHMKLLFKNKGIELSEKDIKEIIYGFDIDNINLSEKPLAKLTKDLYEGY